MSKTDQSENSNTLFNMWREYQDGLMKGQKSLYPGYEAMTTEAMKQTMDAASESWLAWEKQAADWFKTASNWLPIDMKASGGDALVADSLKRMLDPKFFSFAALDEASGSMQRMAEGPEFADIGFVERHMLQSTAEWFAMREADAKYRQVTGDAWVRAFQTFTTEVSSDWSRYSGDSRKVLDRWLEIANDELIKTQRQEDYLDASRKLFRATIDYRLKQRELTEIWCESQSIPTRTEVDDLHRTVTELRRELRVLKRQKAGAAESQSASAESQSASAESQSASAESRSASAESRSVSVKAKQSTKKVAAGKKSARKVTRKNVSKDVSVKDTKVNVREAKGEVTKNKVVDVAVKGEMAKTKAVKKKRVAKKAPPRKSM